MVQKVFFSAVRNEGPFLLEWIAYHRAIGFDRLVIVSNACTDGSDLLLQALAEVGAIWHMDQVVPEGESAQGSAARLVNEQDLLRPGDWAIWLDADEFLNIHAGNGMLEDLLSLIGDRRGMLIPWRLFGDGGQGAFRGRVLGPDFEKAAKKGNRLNREVKVLFRAGEGIEGFGTTGIHRPKLAADTLSAEDFVNASGERLDDQDKRHRRWFSGADFARNNRVGAADAGMKLAQVNHYAVRTPEFFALKRLRGRGWRGGREGAQNNRHTDGFYQMMNRNDVTDRSIQRMIPLVEAEMTRLRSHQVVAEAEAEVLRRTGLALEALTPVPAVVDRPFELTLPEAEAEALREAYAPGSVILEYGSGGSTFVALENGAETVFSVESDADWAARIRGALAQSHPAGDVHVHHADIGPTGGWGKPVSHEASERFHTYASGIWDHPLFRQPDVVLIDGRFRTACFMTTLLRATQGVTILFDDYTNRPEYHWVEDYLTPVRLAGRMAIFKAGPTPLNPQDLTRVAGAFADWR